MLIQVRAMVAVGDLLYPVDADGDVVEVSDEELKTKVLSVEGLPFKMTFGDMDDLQQEAVVLELEAEFSRKLRALRRLPQELSRVVQRLDLSLRLQPTMTDPLAAAHESVGALTFALEEAKRQIEALVQEAA